MASAATEPAGRYDGITLTIHESMSGFFKPGATQPAEGAIAGKQENIQLRFDAQIRIRSLKLSDINRTAEAHQRAVAVAKRDRGTLDRQLPS